MTKRRLGIVAVVYALPLCAPVMVFGQAVYGGISGNVTDSTGAVVPSAKVSITDTGKGVSFTATTNESGNYSQTHLIAGLYTVRVEAFGGKTKAVAR